MKKLSLFFTPLFLIFTIQSFATYTNGNETTFTVLHQSADKIVIEVKVGGFQLVEVQTPNGIEYKAVIDNGSPILEKGAPDLQKLTKSVIIPDDESMQVSSTVQDFTTLTNINIAPSKGSIMRPTDPSTIPFTYSDVYSTDNFFPVTTSSMRQPYIMRDYRGQTIVINPLQYNPVTKELRIAKDIIIELTPSNQPVINPLVRTKPLTTVVDEFDVIYKKHFLNYEATHSQTRYTPITEGGKMLIICADAYLNAMKPFVDWKMQEGISVELVGKSIAGSTNSALKTYVQNYYTTNGLTYLLLVGDATDIPSGVYISGSSTTDSDQKYSFVAGGDFYPDIFVGRFSAENLTDVNTQIDRTVQYEKTPTPGTWYKNGVGIGSEFGGGLQGYLNYADWDFERTLIRAPLLAYNYSSVAELYNGSRAGADASGNPVESDLSSLVNNGVSVINYTGHGDVNLIVTTNFHSTDVDVLTNTRKLPFVWIVGCQTGNFVTNTCFAESWARATDNNGEPTGAIASLMSTVNQSWDEPMAAQAEFNNVLTENATGNIKRTFGGVSVCGLDFMNDYYGSSTSDQMTEAWTCFGDPSVMLRTDQPATMTVTHASSVGLWAHSFPVSCSVNGAKVCCWAYGEILGTATVAGGSATVNFINGDLTLVPGDSMLVTVTAYNKIPKQKWVVISQGVSAPVIADENNIQIFPNPAENKLTIDLTGKSWKNGSIRIYNAIGQMMNEVLLNANAVQQTLDISNLASGVYNVQIVLDEKSMNNKVVLK
ncbi:MAG: T9SS C-terminal target domain-containing protein [Sphingobacteriales bacterium]|nr:MAG: T9SS C-terminal target domain-containing protein [Sphingobacteriales bacterium]